MNSAELVDAGKKYIETTAQMQQELIAKLNTMSLEWLARAQVEADLMSKLSAKLTAARTAPDVASAHSEWFAEWIKLCGENSRRLFLNNQELMKTATHVLSTDWPKGGMGS
ncbi:MAG TPA: hypothetical protein VLJ17_20730 [Xanthobacteraceae bacterium]|nr:hypothetical protein [Xanthobacteraceae bacterium]